MVLGVLCLFLWDLAILCLPYGTRRQSLLKFDVVVGVTMLRMFFGGDCRFCLSRSIGDLVVV